MARVGQHQHMWAHCLQSSPSRPGRRIQLSPLSEPSKQQLCRPRGRRAQQRDLPRTLLPAFLPSFWGTHIWAVLLLGES